VAVRQHLVTKHSIDLESPGACLVEPEPSSSTSSGMVREVYVSRRPTSVTRCDSHTDLITSSSLSPERSLSIEQEQAKDLSTKSRVEKARCETTYRKRAPSPSLGKGSRKHGKILHLNNNMTIHVPLQEVDNNWQCQHCNITFPNQTLYFLHKGFHSDINPWRCNGCGMNCSDMYDFNTHLVSDPHK
jgi:Pyruvate/2-oxoacid:ferredoxin oxidoreductase delta subunit